MTVTNDYYEALLNAITGDKVTAARENNADQSVQDAFDLLPDLVNMLNNSAHFGTDTGTANNYVVARTNPTMALVANTQVVFLAQNANTGASVIDLDGQGNKAILFPDFNSLEAGDIPANTYVWVIYDGTQFLLMATASGILTRGQAQVALAQAAALAASNSAAAALVSEGNAATSESNAATSESNAATSESNASTSETNALASENKAMEWAENAFNDPVEPGEFSAKHYSIVAANATFSFIDIVSDSGTASATQNSDTLNIVGGTGVSTSVSGKTVTITNTGSVANGWGVTNTQSGNISSTTSNDTFTINGAGGILSSGATKTVTLTLDSNVAFTNIAETITQQWLFNAGIKLPDSQKITLGTGDDIEIAFNGVNGVIRSALGPLDVNINSVTRLSVTTDGIDVTGDIKRNGELVIGRTRLSTVVVSTPVTTIDFVNFDDNTKYIGYVLEYSNVTHDAGGNRVMQIQILDSGSPDASTDFNTVYLSYNNSNSGGSPTIVGTNVSHSNTLQITDTIADVDTAIYGTGNGSLHMSGIGDTEYKVFTGISTVVSNTGASAIATNQVTKRLDCSGTWVDTNVNVNGFRLSLSGGGDFRADSNFILYGVTK